MWWFPFALLILAAVVLIGVLVVAHKRRPRS